MQGGPYGIYNNISSLLLTIYFATIVFLKNPMINQIAQKFLINFYHAAVSKG